MADVLTASARQVRRPGGTIHQLVADSFEPERGRIYRTARGATITGVQGGVLTTRRVGCMHCLAAAVKAQMAVGP